MRLFKERNNSDKANAPLVMQDMIFQFKVLLLVGLGRRCVCGGGGQGTLPNHCGASLSGQNI